jgi:Mrp family chromosome partitioning ATPase
VIVVVDLESTTDETVGSALRQLEAVRAPIMGLVLNRDARAEVSKYDQYYQTSQIPSGEDGVPSKPRAPA